MKHPRTALLFLTLFLINPTFAEEPTTKNLPKTMGKIERRSEKLDKLLPKSSKLEVLAGGFIWTEGPVWVPREGGYLLFSDIPRNTIFKWQQGKGVRVFLKPAGYFGDGPWGPEPGTNGLLLNPDGQLVMCEHGNRRVSVLIREKDGIRKALATHWQGKKLNSPNDGVFMRSSGALYFTDPPYGLPKRFEDPHREQSFCGVYRVSKDGKLSLMTKDVPRPNGIGMSPDEKTLYIANSQTEKPIWLAFPIKKDGTLGESKVFHDASEAKKDPANKGNPDGMAVDKDGNLFATGPGGVWIFTPKGELLGKILTGQKTGNCTFGGKDGSVLYVMCDDYICRIQTSTQGIGFANK